MRVALLAALMGFTGLFVLIPNVQAAVWTQTTDVDFNAGTLAGVEVVGSGAPAYVRLAETAMDWRNESPVSAPSQREGVAMVYDAAHGVVVLFGGSTGTYQGDTWEYDPATNTWTQTSSTGPSARAGAGMAYDAVNQVVVLFGGFTSTGPRQDTWEYDAAGNTWTETTPGISPPTLGSYAMVYDSSAGRAILVGGDFSVSSMVTWAYDAAGNAWAERTPLGSPSLRTGLALTYHSGLSRTVLFGGSFLTTVYGDTWEYDYAGDSWTQTSSTGPVARAGHKMGYRGSIDSVLLFGGITTLPTPDTWRYYDVGGTRTWEELPTQRSPSKRNNFGLTDETAGGKSVLFGGALQAGGRSNATWSFGKAFESPGTFTSVVFDSLGANADWTTISWLDATQPPGTTLRFRLASGDSPTTEWIFRGWDGSIVTYYTSPGEAIWSGHDNDRYLVFRAYLETSDNLQTPKMDEVTITYDVLAADPYVVFTDPLDGGSSVPFLYPIFIRFSEPMDVGSVSWTITPTLAVTDSWSEANSALTLSHTDSFLECTAYTVSVSGSDLSGNALVPNPVDPLITNPFTFVSLCDNPEIVATSPMQGDVDVLLAAPIVVDFSEPMNTATVTWTIDPLIGLSAGWSLGDTRLTLTHTADFPQCTIHRVEITAGEDLAGLPLSPGPVPNPWSFKTFCTSPFIVSTDPVHQETNVAVDRPIIVTFSEPMNELLTTWSINPTVTLVPTWTAGSSVTLDHTALFATCTVYTVSFTGQDVDGNPLISGPVPNPWKFATACPNPLIVFTDPADGQVGVDAMRDITVVFSEPMDPASLSWTITPTITLTSRWDATFTIATLSHVVPFVCGPNTVTIVASDAGGDPLLPGFSFVPNPWSFTSVCINPYVVSTSPFDGETGVALDRAIVVTFSEAMNTGSVAWVIVPDITLTASWGGGDTVLTLSHPTTPFAELTLYTVQVAGRDLDGNLLVDGPVPNPWSFTTAPLAPYIVTTDPPDGGTNVGATAPIIVTFSEAMDNVTVNWTITPAVPVVPTWSAGDTILRLDPFMGQFAECTNYTVLITGNDTDGNALIPGPVPNPWSFYTYCTRPFITNTDPVNGTTEVPLNAPIVVNFSEPMNTSSVVVTISPDIALDPAWSNGDRTLTLTHIPDFADCTVYTVMVSGRDLAGNDLTAGPVPNPWNFRSFCAAPFIVSTVPVDGQSNVGLSAPLVITFNRGMDPATVTWTFAPLATATPQWSGGNTVLTLTPSPPLVECTLYQVTIAGRSAEGKDLIPGLVPNPWSFNTICTPGAPGGLQIARVSPAIRLTWTAVPNADEYRVYESQDRFAPWPWAVLGTSTTPSFTATPHESDGLTHFYVLRAVRGTTEGGNSTMAVKITMDVGFNPGTSNIRWFSLPYTTEYTRASDIANELGRQKIDVVAKWNPATQSAILYYWFRGAWRGTDFPINAGNGLYVGSVSAFSWVVVGTDRAVTLSFTRYPNANVNWISLPYTATYQRASDLVRDIEGNTGPGANTKIVEVAKWDAATQTIVRFSWTVGGWTGNDFTLAPGDGIYFRIVSNFTWQPRLITPEVP